MRELVNFNLKCFLDAAEELVRADEVLRALELLNNLPAYYRDFEPIQVSNLRNEILSKIATVNDYKNNDTDDEIANVFIMRDSLRYELIMTDVLKLNEKGISPHIVDYAPGEFWLPILLKADGFSFTYKPIYICDKAFNKTKHLFDDRLSESKSSASIFVACEIIEHLQNESEIKTEMLKNFGKCDIIHLSTPKYSFDYKCTNWRDRKILGHLRAYTPVEFFTKVQSMFFDYKDFLFYDSQILHARAFSRESSIDSFEIRSKKDEIA